jgi:hypothetical protein
LFREKTANEMRVPLSDMLATGVAAPQGTAALHHAGTTSNACGLEKSIS